MSSGISPVSISPVCLLFILSDQTEPLDLSAEC
jgi:hypothetical protein